MPATCYLCVATGTDPPGEPFGACELCSCFACIRDGVRVAGIELFRCNDCYAIRNLLEPGLGQAARADDPAGGGGGTPVDSSPAFEAFQPALAEPSFQARDYYRRNLAEIVELAEEFAIGEAARANVDAALGYTAQAGAAEHRLRADLRAGAQRLTRDIHAAQAAGQFDAELVADAFGVAQHTLRLEPGEAPSPDRLMLLSDARLRFVVGAAAVAMETAVPA